MCDDLFMRNRNLAIQYLKPPIISQMSKIANKAIEAKLKEILGEQGSKDLSKFDDSTALSVIFAHYEDMLTFNELVFDNNLNQISELKLVEVRLRKELEFYKAKISEASQIEWSGGQSQGSRIAEENHRNAEKCIQLQSICQSQEEQLRQNEGGQYLLQKKVLDGVENYTIIQKECELLKAQLDSYKKNDEESKRKIKELFSQIQTLNDEHELEIKKYKGQFIEELQKKLKKQHDEKFLQSEKLNQILQKQLKDQERLFKEAIRYVSEVFKITEPAELKVGLEGWVENLSKKAEEYHSEIKKAVKEDIKESKNPIRQLADNQRRQIQARQLLLSKYLNA